MNGLVNEHFRNYTKALWTGGDIIMSKCSGSGFSKWIFPEGIKIFIGADCDDCYIEDSDIPSSAQFWVAGGSRTSQTGGRNRIQRLSIADGKLCLAGVGHIVTDLALRGTATIQLGLPPLPWGQPDLSGVSDLTLGRIRFNQVDVGGDDLGALYGGADFTMTATLFDISFDSLPRGIGLYMDDGITGISVRGMRATNCNVPYEIGGGLVNMEGVYCKGNAQPGRWDNRLVTGLPVPTAPNLLKDPKTKPPGAEPSYGKVYALAQPCLAAPAWLAKVPGIAGMIARFAGTKGTVTTAAGSDPCPVWVPPLRA